MYVQNSITIPAVVAADMQAIWLDKGGRCSTPQSYAEEHIAEQNGRIKAEQIFLNDPFLSLLGTCPSYSAHLWPSVAFH